jgi:hypothetical protein
MKRIGIILAVLFCFKFVPFLLLPGCGGSSNPGPEVTPSPTPSPAPAALSTLEDEKAVFKPSLDSLKAALVARDPAGAASTFVPELQDRYKAFFERNPDTLSKLASALETGELTLVGDHEIHALDGTTRRVGNLDVTCDGIVFHVTVVKVGGVWKFKSF